MGTGDRVVVVAPWHSYRYRTGRVAQVRPLFVLFDGDRVPEAIEERAVLVLDESSRHLGGAE